MGHALFQGRLRRHIPHPFAKEKRGVSEIGSRPGEYLGVPRPSQPLVPLGAVGGDIEEVVPHAPGNIALELVDLFIRCMEGTDRLHVGVHHAGSEHLRLHLINAIHADIAEPMESKMRQECLLFPIADIGVNGSCLTQCLRIEVSVLIKHLCVAHRDLLPLLPFDPDLCQPGDILSEINQTLSLRGHDQFFCRDALCDADRFILLSGKDALVKFFGGDFSFPDLRAVRIDGLAHVYLAVTDFAGAHAPALVRAYHFTFTVFIANMEFRKRAHSVAVDIWGAHKSEDAFVPAVSDSHFQQVLPALQLPCHVVGLVLETAAVAGPPRRHPVLSGFHAVYSKFIDSLCRRVEACFLHIAF